MKTAYHLIFISLAIAFTYIWLRLPSFNQYSLQLFAITILSYFVIKKVHNAKFWQLLPAHGSIEMAVVTLTFLLLIGATGNLRSALFFLSFIHLFLLVLKTDIVTASVVTIEIVLFHLALTANPTMGELSFLTSLPLVMLFFLFAKQQYYQVYHQQQLLEAEQRQLTEALHIDRKLQDFLGGFLEQKLGKLQQLSFSPTENQQQMREEMAEIAALTDELIAETQVEAEQVVEQNLKETLTPTDPENQAELESRITNSIDIFETTVVTTEVTTPLASDNETSQSSPTAQS